MFTSLAEAQITYLAIRDMDLYRDSLPSLITWTDTDDDGNLTVQGDSPYTGWEFVEIMTIPEDQWLTWENLEPGLHRQAMYEMVELFEPTS